MADLGEARRIERGLAEAAAVVIHRLERCRHAVTPFSFPMARRVCVTIQVVSGTVQSPATALHRKERDPGPGALRSASHRRPPPAPRAPWAKHTAACRCRDSGRPSRADATGTWQAG